MSASTPLMRAALSYAGRGWPVFPLHTIRDGHCTCGQSGCPSPGKHPRTPSGFYDATTDEPQIRTWWKRWQNANIGIRTGRESGLVVLDEDPRNEGYETRATWEEKHGKLPHTVRVRTGGGGTHYLFAYPCNRDLSCKDIGRGVEIKAEGGYIVAAPSQHASGACYTWDLGAHPDDTPLAETPPWVLDLVASNGHSQRRGSKKHANDGDFPDADLEKIEAECPWMRHCRNDAGSLSEPEWFAQLSIIARCKNGEDLARERSRPYPGYSESETIRKLRHAAEDGGPRTCGSVSEATWGRDHCSRCKNRGKITTPLQLGREQVQDRPRPHRSDLGNAERLVQLHGRDLRFCHGRGWLHWDGRRWVPDQTGEVVDRAKDTVRHMYAEASRVEDEEDRTKLLRHALAAEAERRIRAMIALAQSEPGIPITPDQLDSDPWLLNCANGTLDLRTGDLRPHRPEDLLTKLSPVDYDPTALCRTWDSFLERIFDRNTDLIEFVQRATGYALTGDVSEQVLFVLYGTGANGKSTLLNTIQRTLGDYAKQADPDLLIAKRNDSHPTGVADLVGSRFVASNEVERGKALAEMLVKQLTGGDRLKARYMRQDFFEFDPTHKLFLAVNHKPVIRGADGAIWRRINLIPFAVTIPNHEQDRGLLQKLLAERVGILAWAVRGSREWRKLGLTPPAEVMSATSEYQAEMDRLGNFFEDRCVLEPARTTSAQELYAEYRNWCDQNREKPMAKRSFGMALAERRFINLKEKGQRVWRGIGILGEVVGHD